MTAEAGGEAATEMTSPVVEQTVEDTGPSEVETRARELGWVPEAEWKGDKKPAKFLPAEEFIERGETIIPLLKSQIARQEKAFADRLDKIEKMNTKTLAAAEKQHETKIAELENAVRWAAHNGKGVEFDAYNAQLAEARKDGPAIAAPADPVENKKALQDKWIADNPWYQDEDMGAYAFGVSNRLAESNPSLSFEENLRQTTEKVKARYPEKFGKPAANAHAAVDGGGSLGSPAPRNDPLAKLPNEARTKAKADMAKFPKIYPNAQAWVDAYNS